MLRENQSEAGVPTSELSRQLPMPRTILPGSVVEIPYLDDEIVVVVPMLHPWRQLAEIPLDTFLANTIDHA